MHCCIYNVCCGYLLHRACSIQFKCTACSTLCTHSTWYPLHVLKLYILQITNQQICMIIATAIPPLVFQLLTLMELDLTSNHIVGAIPGAISCLTALQKLKMIRNELTSGLEHVLTLTELRILDLSYSELAGNFFRIHIILFVFRLTVQYLWWIQEVPFHRS